MRRAALPLALLLLAVAAGAWAPAARGAGPTYVAGEISGAWTLDASPYVVTGPAVVPALATLTVGPGVEVRFDPGASLLVRGGLAVDGLDARPVAFTSNGSAAAGSWAGIAVTGHASLAFATVAYAGTGLDLGAGAVAAVDRLVVSHSLVGLRVNRSSATVSRSSFSLNEVAGVEVAAATLGLVGTGLTSNAWGLSLAEATVSVENGSIAGSAIGDADLVASKLTLLNTTSGGTFAFHDAASSVTERWYAHVSVADVFATPVSGASVTVGGGGLPSPVARETDPAGWARWITLTGRVSTSAGRSVPAYTFTAAAKGSVASRSASLAGETIVPLALPADVTAPVAVAGPDVSVAEGRPVAFDARGSTDNDPAFPSGATFAWRTEENGTPVVLSGATAAYAFHVPGRYTVVLTVTDAAGNSGVDALVVTVRDTTPPVAGMSIPARVTAGEPIVLDAGPSRDNDPAFPVTGNFTWTVASGGRTLTLHGRVVTVSDWGPGAYAVTLAVRDAAGNADSVAGSVEVVPRPDPVPLLAALAGALAAWFAALGVWGTERGRLAFLSWFVLPLFTRTNRDEVLDQFTRGQIYGYIVVHPGDSYMDIKRNLDLNNGTLTHHLQVLERDGMVVSKAVGTRRLFFAKGARVPEDGGGVHEVQLRIVNQLKETGGLAVNDVAGAVGISRQLAIYHLRDLRRKGLVRIERKAFRIVAFAEEPGAPPPGTP